MVRIYAQHILIVAPAICAAVDIAKLSFAADLIGTLQR